MAKPKNPNRVQKHGRGYAYYLDDVKVPSVTRILDAGIPKPALQGWAAEQTANFVADRLEVRRFDPNGPEHIIADDVVEDALAWNRTRTQGRERVNDADRLNRGAVARILKNIRYRDLAAAATRGTDVHNFGEKLARGETVEVPDADAAHVASYVDFLNDWRPRNALVECVGLNRRWRYGGRFDLLADFGHMLWTDGPRAGSPMGRGLGDIKTSRSGIFAEVGIQLEAYAHLDFLLTDDGELPMPSVDFVFAIHVRADGYDVYTFDRGPDGTGEQTFRTFLYAKQLGEWLDRSDGAAATIRSDSRTAPISLEEATA